MKKAEHRTSNIEFPDETPPLVPSAFGVQCSMFFLWPPVALLLLAMFSLVGNAAEPISLAGQWRFALDRKDAGVAEQWFNRDLADKINLPGALQAQGYGDEISTNTPWVLSLYDKNWFLRADYTNYARPGAVKVPFLCQPPRHYLGAAWYQRDIEIPQDWQERRVVLFLERPHWESRVWLDDQLIGTNNSLCTPHEFELGVVVARASRPSDSMANQKLTGGTPVPLKIAPGKHRLTVRVDNRMLLAYRPDAHSVSDSLGQSWNGVVGKMELRSTPLVWIEDAQVFPNVGKGEVLVKVKMGNLSGKPGSGKISISHAVLPGDIDDSRLFAMSSHNVSWSTNGGAIDLTIQLQYKGLVWDEFNPVVRDLLLNLQAESESDSRSFRFGLRNFKTVGTDLEINGRETFLRGTHHGGDFPLTGYPPTDVDYWRKTFQTVKDWGLNHVRFHSFCPPEAAFEAADELGLYLQIEPGMWNTFSPGSPMEAMLYAETERILKAYGNHPSFVLFSPSNEPKGKWKDVLPKWAEHFRAADPRRLYTSGTGFTDADAPGPLDRVDFTATQRFGPARVRGEGAWFGRDYARSVQGVNVPVITHEVGQWCAYPDYDVIQKFTGYMRPGNFEIFRDSADAHGLLQDRSRGRESALTGSTAGEMDAPTNVGGYGVKGFAIASGKFQLACYKEEIEANLRTPGLAGFQLLDLHDYVGQGTALVGLLDAFWEEKGYATPEDFRRFCSPVVPLARLTKRVFTTADKFDVPVEVANFAAAPLTNVVATWQIVDAKNQVVVQGSWPAQTIPLGKSFPMGRITADLSKLATPGRYRLVVKVGQASRLPAERSEATARADALMGGRDARPTFANDWNFWLYPAKVSGAPSPDVSVISSWDDAEAKLAAGGKVLFLPRNADLAWDSPPLDTVPVFWNRLMNPAWGRMLGLWCDTNHPALAGFPTEPNCDWQWTQITRGVRPVNLGRLPRGLQPIVSAIDDWNRNWKLGAILECKVGPGRLLVSAFDLSTDLENRPVARQLRRSLLDYMAGEKFQPKVEVSAAEFRGVLFDTRIMRKLGARARGDGLDAPAAIDGDPNSIWITGEASRNRKASPYPHELTVVFSTPVAMTGIVLMPRQNDRDHLGDVRGYKLETSDDGTNWFARAQGELASTWNPQRLEFGRTITASQIRFTALSGFGRDTSVAVAELAVVYAGPKLAVKDTGNVEYRRSRSTSADVDEGADAPIRRRTNAIPRNP